MADKDVMKGHPGADDGKAPDTNDSIAEIELGGKKYAVDKTLAEALEASRKAEESKFTALQSTVQKLQEEVRAGKPPQGEPPKKDEVLSNTDLLFTNPEAYLAKFQEKIEAEVTTKLTSAYQREEGRKQFWQKFYEVNDDLKPDKDQIIIDAVMQRDYEELVNLPVGEQYKALGEKVRGEILKIVGKKNSGDSQQGARPLEGRSTPSPREVPGQNASADEPVVSISGILAARRAERMKARTSKTA